MLNISFNDYIKIDAVSRSDLLNLNRSSKYYLYISENGTEDTEAMRFGRMVHKYVLENNKFFDDYFLIETKINKRTKIGKEALEDIKKEAGTKEIITNEELKLLDEIQKSLLSNKLISEKGLLDNFLTEQTLIWETVIDDNISIKCKCRSDKIRMTEKSNSIIDLKTTCNIDKFNNDIFLHNYHIQAAFYMDAFLAVTHKICDKFIFVVVEKTKPYLNDIFYIDNGSDEHLFGKSEYMKLLIKYSELKKNNFNENPGAKKVIMPGWYKFKNVN